MKFSELTTTTGNVEAGKIANVKILGYQSKNGRTYSKQAVEAACHKYEGAPVYVNHSKDAARKVEDKFGSFSNIHITDDGLYGDLLYLETHPVADPVIESIQKNLNYFGMSHCVLGTSKKIDGKEVVESIDEVESVDLVSNPATTKGFFEQVEVPTEEQIMEEKDNEITQLKAEIELLKEQVAKLTPPKEKISEVICSPMTVSEDIGSSYPTDLKKWFSE